MRLVYWTAGVAGSPGFGELRVEFRYYLDPETGQPHIYDHGVTEAEVEWISGSSGRGWAIFGRIEAVHRADFGRPLLEGHLRP